MHQPGGAKRSIPQIMIRLTNKPCFPTEPVWSSSSAVPPTMNKKRPTIFHNNLMHGHAGTQDMNNDGYGDIAIGHALADPLSGGDSSGATYVVFGGGAIPSPLNVLTDLDGSNGFVLEGASEGDRSGTSVSDAGVREKGSEEDTGG